MFLFTQKEGSAVVTNIANRLGAPGLEHSFMAKDLKTYKLGDKVMYPLFLYSLGLCRMGQMAGSGMWPIPSFIGHRSMTLFSS